MKIDKTVKKITSEWLQKQNACHGGSEWFRNQTEIKADAVVEKLVAENKLEWASWLITRVMNHKQRIAYAIFAAEQVLEIYETKNPNDKRPREAIEAAQAVLKRNSQKNRTAANAAAAYAAAAYPHAYAAAAAYAAAYAAHAYAYAAHAYAAAAHAYAAAAHAYAAANAEIQKRILAFGIELIRSAK